MAAMPTRRGTLFVAVVLATFVASPVLAKPPLQGTFGTERFKSKKQFTHCTYVRAVSLFSIQAIKAKRKKQTGLIVGGVGADPTVPGAAFPIVLDTATASFINGPPPTPPTWTSVFGGNIVITLTGYAKGKVSGTITGTLAPSPVGGATGDVAVDATFTIKCNVQ